MPDDLAQRPTARFLLLSPLAGVFAALLFLAATHANSVSAANQPPSAQPASASPAAKSAPAPIHNIVLVHGAWADGSGWQSVADLLTARGFRVTIVQEPETTFADNVAATRRILALQDGPAVLVAHSYGGAVITEAGNDPHVAALVYIAAHMPDAGENESDDGKRFPSDLSKSGAIQKTSDGFTYLD